MELARLVLDFLRVLIWPITTVLLFVLFRRQIVQMVARLRHADLPGGVSFDLQEAVNQTQQLSEIVLSSAPPDGQKKGASIPLTEVNARLLSLNLHPSPSGLDMSYYRTLAEQDPNIALAGLRIELEILLGNLVKGFRVQTRTHSTGTRLLQTLFENNAITSDQKQLAMKILSVCNAAVHGGYVSLEEALTVIDSAEVLTDQYVSWLSWGFSDGWEPHGGKSEDIS